MKFEKRPIFVAALLLAFVMAILLWTGTLRFPSGGGENVLPAAGERVVLTGTVCQIQENQFLVRSVTSDQNNSNAASSQQTRTNSKSEYSSMQGGTIAGKILCEWENAKELSLGSLVSLEGTFTPFSHATNPGEFDQKTYYRSIRMVGKLRSIEILQEKHPIFPAQEYLARFRRFCGERLLACMPQKEAATMKALLLGEKQGLDEETKALYKRSGILHILSISSLHITILGVGTYQLLRRVGTPVWIAAPICSLLMLAYGSMAGFGVSVTRAVIMFLLRMLAYLLGRTYDLLCALSLTAAVMLLYHPYYLENSGFLLSFASVLGIAVLAPVMRKMWRKETEATEAEARGRGIRERARRMGKRIGANLSMSFAITLMTLPIQLWFYYEVPTYSVFLNLLVLPFTKPLLICGVASLALPLPVGGWVAQGAVLILKWYELICQLFEKLPFSVWNPGKPLPWQVILYYVLLVGVLGLMWVLGTFGTHGRFGALCNLMLCLPVLVFALRDSSEGKVTFLDVGQGDCAIVQLESGETYLIDCGSSSRSLVGEYVLLPYLKYHGIRKVDAILISHPDADHANGAIELLRYAKDQRIGVGQLVLPEIAPGDREGFADLLIAAKEAYDGAGVPVTYLAKGDGWACKNATFLCLHPPAGYTGKEVNAYSQCLYLTFGDVRNPDLTVLFTGDVEAAGEEALLNALRERNISHVDVLKVAHHGSAYSTSAALLAQMRPRLAVISVASNSRYGHPHQETLTRLARSGAQVYRTDHFGALTILASP